MFDWNNLKALLAIAKAGTLSGASRAINVSQPTLSRRLSDLEADVGSKLFDRRRDGYHLTETGRRVREHALQMETEAIQILDESEARTLPEGNIVITANAGFSANCLIPVLRRFQQKHPKITFEVITTYTPLNVTRRAADIAIRLGDAQSDTLECRLLGKTSFGLLGSRNYFRQNPEPDSIEDLPNHRTLGATGDLAMLVQNKLLAKLQGTASCPFVSDSFTDHLSAMEAGFGLTTAAMYMVYTNKNVKRILKDQFNPSLEMWLLAHKDYVFSKRVKLLMNFLELELSELLEQVNLGGANE